jgi:hypothetical protein
MDQALQLEDAVARDGVGDGQREGQEAQEGQVGARQGHPGSAGQGQGQRG